jgi:hypothetical protein
MADCPTVFVCRGSNCRKHHNKDLKSLYECLDPVACVEEVRCQRVCEGPLVGTQVDGTIEWFCRMDSEKALHNLVAGIAGGELRKPLRKRHVEERSGRLR